MPTFAAIDIGSNSCRLKIARVHAHRLKTLAEDREVTRLGGSVFDTGLISPEAMAATLRALKRFQRAVQAHGVDRVRVVATSAMRDARNSAAFQAWVKAETGWNMEIISGLEEGRLIHLGVSGTEPGAGGRVLLLDLGGGSCEITFSEHKHIKDTISLPLGAVRLTEQFLSDDPAPRDGLKRMRQLIARQLRRSQLLTLREQKMANPAQRRQASWAQNRALAALTIAPHFWPEWCPPEPCASWPASSPKCRCRSAKQCRASAHAARRSLLPAPKFTPRSLRASA